MEFDAFFRTSKDKILRAVIASTGDQYDAESCVAEALWRAFKEWPKLRKLGSPAAWVVRVAINLHTDRHRQHLVSKKHWPVLVQPEIYNQDPGGLDPNLLAGINDLPIRQREVLVHRILLGLSAHETASELSISVATVSTHLHRALAALREKLHTPKQMES